MNTEMVSPKGGASSQRLDHLGRRGGREILFWSIARFSVCDPFSVFCFVSASVIYHYMHLVRHGTHFLKPQTQRHSRLHPSSLFFLFFSSPTPPPLPLHSTPSLFSCILFAAAATTAAAVVPAHTLCRGVARMRRHDQHGVPRLLAHAALG